SPTVAPASSPTVAPSPAAPATAADAARTMPLDVKVGQLIMAGFTGTTADAEAARLIEQHHIGNVVLLGRNVGAPADVLALTDDLQRRAVAANGQPLLIAIDQEGGRVQRFRPPFTQFPAAATWGCAGAAHTEAVAAVMAREMAAVGVNAGLAPVADVLTNPANTVIGDRAFSSDRALVAEHVLAAVAGLREGGVLSTVKHFPGHGSTDGDSHDGPVVLADSLADLEATELVPFRAAAPVADLMMTANVAYAALDPEDRPASLSPPTIAFLRDDVGFNGVIITDDLLMGAVASRWDAGEAGVLALVAGADLLLYASGGAAVEAAQAVQRAVQDGRIPETRIDESLQRVLALKGRLATSGRPPLDAVGSPEHQATVDALVRAGSRC
ncbi:MAG TPA: glycoside hydrolase family 3 protein, partial [Dehalococcoidia bacterium]|nr:glycoside hydrolase family 3 protein [Dehalococcoidia bacterium]